MQQHGMMMQGGMDMMMAHPGPGMPLRLQNTLELSDAQVEELAALRSAMQEMHGDGHGMRGEGMGRGMQHRDRTGG